MPWLEREGLARGGVRRGGVGVEPRDSGSPPPSNWLSSWVVSGDVSYTVCGTAATALRGVGRTPTGLLGGTRQGSSWA